MAQNNHSRIATSLGAIHPRYWALGRQPSSEYASFLRMSVSLSSLLSLLSLPLLSFPLLSLYLCFSSLVVAPDMKGR